MIEYDYRSITDANNIIADAFSHASSSQRKNTDAIFTSDNLDKLGKLVNAINSLSINKVRYELNKETASDVQGNLTSDPDIVTHTSKRIWTTKLLSFRTS